MKKIIFNICLIVTIVTSLGCQTTDNIADMKKNAKKLKIKKGRTYFHSQGGDIFQFKIEENDYLFKISNVSGESYVSFNFPEDQLKFTVSTGTSKKIDLKKSSREVEVAVVGVSRGVAKIKIQFGKYLAKYSDKGNQRKILFKVKFLEETTIDLSIDGKKKTSGSMPGGSEISWNAKNKIDVKFGDAGKVKIVINDEDYDFGKSGKPAHKIIEWQKGEKHGLYNILVKDYKK